METATLQGPSVPPASGRPARSMVVLLHGYGSNGDDLIGLVPYWRAALPDTVFLSPNAPQPCPGAPGGRQWWPLASLSPGSRAAGVREAAPVLDGFIDAQLAAHGLSDDRLALVGFSQGTMVALHVGLRRAGRIAGIVGYSGMLADPEGLAGPHPPVLLVHGDADPVAQQALTAAGVDVAAHVSRGLQHSIDDAGLRLGGEFLARALA
jgi:phospholipase/carboxylesterase